MQRLAGRDAHYFYEEHPSTPMHTAKVLVVRPGPGGLDTEMLRAALAERVGALWPLRQRIVAAPGRLFHPSWVEAGPPDFDRHLLSATVPGPGDDEATAAVVSRLVSEPLDRRHPLWQLWVLDGRRDGTVLLLLKLHHSLADGTSSARLLTELFGSDPLPAAQPPADPVPGRLHALAALPGPMTRQLRTLPSLIRRSLSSTVAGRAARREGAAPPKAFTCPDMAWNRGLTSTRSFRWTSVPLDEVKRVGARHGCSLGDVVLAVTAGALRAYLDERGELPERSLTATVPVSLREEHDGDYGNRIGQLFTTLASDVADPVARLQAVHAGFVAAKAYAARRDPLLFEDWWDWYPAFRLAHIGAVRLMRALASVPTFNVIVSVVRGPRTVLQVAGCPVTAVHSMGPLVDDIGLNVTSWSYENQLSFGLTACPEAVPELGHLADLVQAAFAELVAASGDPAVAGPDAGVQATLPATTRASLPATTQASLLAMAPADRSAVPSAPVVS